VSPIRTLKELLGSLRSAADAIPQGIRDLASLTDQQASQLAEGISNLAALTDQRMREIYAALDNQAKQLDAGFTSVVAAIQTSSGMLSQPHGEILPVKPKDGGNSEHLSDVDRPVPAPDPRAGLIDNILETGQQPFIQIACDAGTFLNLLTHDNLADYVDRLEKSSIFARSQFLRGLCLSLRRDLDHASEQFFNWIETDDEDVRLEVVDLECIDHDVPFRLQYPAYRVAGSEAGDLATDFRSPSARARSLSQAVALYDSSRGNDSCRASLIEGASLALVRYFASMGRLKAAQDQITLALKYGPGSSYLGAAHRALNLKIANKPVPADLAKFVGQNSGAD
jgi:tetratricopeptide (TPR) repeat protein